MAARRPVRALFVAGAAIVVLVAAFFVGDAIARGIVQDRIRGEIVTALDLPDDADVAVSVGGIVIPQLIGGRLGDVHLQASDLVFEGLSGDVEAWAHGLPVRGDDVAGLGGTAVVSMDAADVSSLLRTAVGDAAPWPDLDVSLPGPEAEFSTQLSALGMSLPLSFSAVPGVSSTGDVQISPESIRVGALELSAEDVAQAPVDLGALTQPITICRADALPAGLEVVSAEVADDALAIRLAFADGFAVDLDALAAASCS